MLTMSTTPQSPVGEALRGTGPAALRGSGPAALRGTGPAAAPAAIWEVMRRRVRAMRREDSGFALIEPLIVLAIVGTLSGIVGTAVAGAPDRAATVACKLDKNTVEGASQAYFALHGSYAASMEDLVNAEFLRDAPVTTNGYTITYNSAGAVGVAPGGPCN